MGLLWIMVGGWWGMAGFVVDRGWVWWIMVGYVWRAFFASPTCAVHGQRSLEPTYVLSTYARVCARSYVPRAPNYGCP